MFCNCPQKSALSSVPTVKCPEKFGQIQKFAVCRLRKANGEKNGFPTLTADIKTKASWTKLLSAEDDTKMVISPYVMAPGGEPGEPRTFGGGNDTLGGVEIIIGRNPTPFNGVLRNMPQQSVIAPLKELECEDGNLGVFLFDEYGRIEGIKATPSETEVIYPIPIRSFFVSDKGHGNFDAPDYNNVQWSFLPNYSDNLVIIQPTDFNPLTDLVVEEA